MSNGLVISGFPGIGKSFLTNKYGDRVSDSDSSKFSWSSPGVRHPDFPSNYVEHIKDVLPAKELVFVSSHDVVRQALIDAGIPFILVYPLRYLKNDYIARYKARGNDDAFIKMMESKFESFIDECDKTATNPLVTAVRLGRGQYLSSIPQVQLS